MLLGVTVAGAVASAVDTALLFAGGRNLDRVYYGTDTRAASLLIGASLAIGLAIARARAAVGPGDRRRPRGAGAVPRSLRDRLLGAGAARQRVLAAGAVVALGAVLAAAAVVDGSDGWLYPYGLLALDGAVVLLILAAVTQPASLAARALAYPPLRALGKISYGLYLWHFPLFLWLTAGAVGFGGTPLLLVRLAVTLAVSTASYFLIEQPIRQRRRPTWFVRALAPLAAGGAVAALLLASAADQLPVGVPAAATLPQPPPQLRGHDPSCTVALKDTPDYGVAPRAREQGDPVRIHGAGLSPADLERVEREDVPDVSAQAGADGRRLAGVHARSAVAEQRGALRRRARGRCAPGVCVHHRGRARRRWHLDGTVAGLSDRRRALGCGGERDARSDGRRRARVPGQLDWKIDGKVVHLGQPAFDAYVQKQIDRFVQIMGAGGRKILFLSIPYVDPPNLPDGSPAPQASPARHTLINSMLEQAARRHPSTVSVLDIDQTVSPGNHYNAKVNGQLCRFDGVHFSAYCSELLEPRALGEVRKLLG